MDIRSLSLPDALHRNFTITTLVQQFTSKWIGLLRQIIEGCYCLHSKNKINHNDLKCDNTVLTSENTLGSLRAIIVKFNKACKVGKKKKYNSHAENKKNKTSP